ncbi:IS200/IS605 family element transposase accessory protein TnpB [Thermanaerosceptrum fracticalcis]|uniref:IS200/IS605 family element transposase accessory protein TnpB n=1 Tax=Thermanaerosceptrum fracticalcis TaxID=1712410 RepID=A0A7G6E4B6_THEFR|nr:IS200/IS605 family accessory protein TnpB-related protein [Thermanaerosceptrum fracticalcis]QNB46920.1 IS200/IS605 family element transposase accessory protein TnpB [Thermanaerosceptrum fracticalcis]
MKTTVMGVILELTETQQAYLDNLMARYCAAVRWSFKRLLEGKGVQDIRQGVQVKFNLNSRQANDAVYDAQSTIKSQHELVKLYCENARAKVEFTQKRIAKAKSSKQKANLQKRLEKEQRKLSYWQKHLEGKTFPTVVFGGKKLFLERCKGNITRAEWQEARNNRYLSRGDKTKGGNLNTRLYEVDGQIYLDIAAEQVQTEKSVRYNRITVPVYLAHKPSQKTGKINGRNYRQMVLDYLKTGAAYQVEIIRKDGRYYIHVTIEEDMPVPYHAQGAVGVDTNPDGLGVALTDYLGQYRGSQWLRQGEWTYARSNRRDNLIGETVKKVVALAKETGSALVIEDLKFKHDKSVTTKFNRMSHGFVWSKFLADAERRAFREGVPVFKAKPAFTSVIGILKYQHQYGLSNHQAAALVIARRGLGFDYERVPKLLADRFIKAKEGFSKINNWQQWAAVKKAILKQLKKKEKKGVNSLVSWQVHRKQLLGAG